MTIGQQFDYVFDDIGNRDTTGGRVSAVSDYTANRLNQHTQRTVPAYVDVMGIANPTAGVTVNGNTATRRGEYYHYALDVPNSTAQYQTVTVVSQYGAGQTESGKAYVPPATESFGYDADGNLTSDGRWTYTWDGENRLVQMIRDTDTPSGARQKLVFEYDWQGRRIRKQFYTYSGGWIEQSDLLSLYDGWNLMGELNANASNAKVRTYVWGTDLSGSMTGAGGVGGLLVVTDHSSPVTHHFVASDGNGNVAGLVDTSNGSLSARYDYGPFGESVRATGPMADLNPIRFSTKHTDPESGLLYYGYRYYNPSTGRWLNRDPIAERGGCNLYPFVSNWPTDAIDPLGLALRLSVKVTTYGGSVDRKPSELFTYIDTSDRVTGVWMRLGASIHRALATTDDTAYGSIRGMTRVSDLPTKYTGLQQCNQLKGTISVFGCCGEGGPMLRWKIEASFTAAGPVEGLAKAVAFLGPWHVQARSPPPDKKEGTTPLHIPQGGQVDIPFSLDQGWIDYNRTGGWGVLSDAKFVVHAYCTRGR